MVPIQDLITNDETAFAIAAMFCSALMSDAAQGKLQGVGFLQISSILPMQNQGVLLGVHRCYCHEAVMPDVKQSCDRSI